MELGAHYNFEIHDNIREFINLKSLRDNKKFTASQLADAIGVPHSVLVKLLHKDPEKRVKNPRIDTLVKIVAFFQKDGFDISIDSLLGKTTVKLEDTQELRFKTLTLPCFPANRSGISKSSSFKEIEIPESVETPFITELSEDITSLFKKGTLLIIDKSQAPIDNCLLMIKDKEANEIMIRKFAISGEEKILLCLDNNQNNLLFKKNVHDVLGVIVHAQISTV